MRASRWLPLAALVACRDYDRFRHAPDAAALRDCVTHPSACGFPDETTTGVATRGALTSLGASYEVTAPGATVENAEITVRLTVSADRVTVRNVRIHASGYYGVIESGDFTGLVLENVEVVGDGSAGSTGIACSNCVIRAADVHGVDTGILAGDGVDLERSYVHDVSTTIESAGSRDDQAHGSTLLATRGTNPCVNFTGGPIDGLVLDASLFQGTAAPLIDLGSGTNTPTAVITGNRIVRRASDALLQLHTPPGTFTWSGNVWDDTGEAIPSP